VALETYRAKRDFTVTAEPAGTDRRGHGDAFVVQKHAARRLHYDFRLEIGDVLASWAVTRGPSLVPGEKRLAVHVEDHPLDYGDFEGEIAKGQYGAGEVIVWDRGRWQPEGDPVRGMKKGRLDFTLEGVKLKGRWHLVRMAGKPGEKRENWLLIKARDDAAREPSDPDILAEAPGSVISGRTLEDIAEGRPATAPPARKPARKPAGKAAGKAAGAKGKATGKAKADPFPGFVPPALATLRPSPPTGEPWVHEIKFDGYRLQAQIRNGKVRLLTRSGQDWSDRFGEAVPAALAALPCDSAILDGELVVETATGASDFSALQADLSAGRSDRFRLYLFDALYLDGADLRRAALTERKARLQRLLDGAPEPLGFSEHFVEDGEVMLRHACRLSLEGLVSKKADAPYPTGRSRSWIKSKCSNRQEFVIAGYVPSTVSDDLVGSLALGYHRDGKLVYAGRVGTGFSRAVARDLAAKLGALRRKTPPFPEKLAADARRGAIWVKPELVAEVEFRAWTSEGILRHAAFRGLREDKPAREIVREAAVKEEAAGKAASPAPPKVRPAVRLTNPDRVYWPDVGLTKEGLADYYTQVYARMAPALVRRPVALLRCPGGIEGQCFFQKHAWKGLAREILTFHDPLDDDEDPLVAVDGLPGLIGLVQGGALEIHTWQSSLEDLEHPDQIVMDLDPGEGVAWQAVIDAALEIRQRLADVGLAAFVKTSGGKGLHVVAPLAPSEAAGWDRVKGFAQRMAKSMAADDPERYVATITKSKRTGRILIDYLRNGRNNTAVVAYGSRARPGAPVSMPLAWEDLGPAIGPAHFTVANAPAHVANTPDPWEDFRSAARPLPEA
jgi:bifunctional non-homologous end joining protein LigD